MCLFTFAFTIVLLKSFPADTFVGITFGIVSALGVRKIRAGVGQLAYVHFVLY